MFDWLTNNLAASFAAERAAAEKENAGKALNHVGLHHATTPTSDISGTALEVHCISRRASLS